MLDRPGKYAGRSSFCSRGPDARAVDRHSAFTRPLYRTSLASRSSAYRCTAGGISLRATEFCVLDGRFEVVGTVADGSLLVDTAARLRRNVIVIDISMPKLSGIE